MKDPIKVTEEELKLATDLQNDFQTTLFEFGNLYVEKIQIDNAIRTIAEKEDELQKKWKDLQNKENILIQNMYEKYGDGQLNLPKGLFVPKS